MWANICGPGRARETCTISQEAGKENAGRPKKCTQGTSFVQAPHHPAVKVAPIAMELWQACCKPADIWLLHDIHHARQLHSTHRPPGAPPTFFMIASNLLSVLLPPAPPASVPVPRNAQDGTCKCMNDTWLQVADLVKGMPDIPLKPSCPSLFSTPLFGNDCC